MSESLKQLLANLQTTYLATFPEKADNLHTLWKDGQLESLHTEYHKLKGTGRTYGLPEVSKLGETLEKICNQKPNLLATAVPLSILILDKIRLQRVSGRAFALDADQDYQAILSLLGKFTSTASGGSGISGGS